MNRLRSVSKKRQKVMRGDADTVGRTELNKELVDAPRHCEVGLVFRGAGIPSRCTGRATCWHEKRKRSSTGSIVKRCNLMASCASCNGQVEDWPDQRRIHDLGLVLREGDPEWDECVV